LSENVMGKASHTYPNWHYALWLKYIFQAITIDFPSI